MGNGYYKWSVKEKQKLIKRFEEYGWQAKYYKDFGCSRETCKNELKRLGYIKED